MMQTNGPKSDAAALARMSVRALGDGCGRPSLRLACMPGSGGGADAGSRGGAADSAAVEREWARQCAANPRLRDGPILRVVEVDGPGARIGCTVGSYKLLAVGASVPTGTMQLGVKGVIIGLDVTGRPHVLLGRRGAETRIYGGMWEVGPGGGIEPPADLLAGKPCELGEAEVLRELAKEGREELGLEIRPHECRVVAVLRDGVAQSEDVVVRVEIAGAIDLACRMKGEHAWEYTDTRWVMLADLCFFDADHAAEISPPTRAIFRWMEWVV